MSKPKFEDTEALPEDKPKFEETASVSSPGEISGFQKFMNVLDIPGSLVRTGAEAALSPDREVLPAMSEQIVKTFENPTTAAQSAPTGADVNKALFPDIKNESAPGKIASFTTEVALDPTQWFSWSAPVKSAVRKPVMRASERQAAKAVSKFATATDVTKEGADLEMIGSRLVAEDMQGLLRNPQELYYKLGGKRHLQKLNPNSLETLQIKRGPREGGKIGDISQDITDAIDLTEKQYKIRPQVPANIMGKQLLEKMKVALSKTSGETPDLSGIERTLEQALKPFDTTKIPDIPIQGVVKTPGSLELGKETIGKIPGGVDKAPTSMSLTDLHQLRKNIGKLVADRAFYADPSQAMRTETEALRDLYRELGSTIKSQLAGKKINIGTNSVDAGQYYEAQNNRLKAFLDLESMLEYQPTKKLKEADIPALMASMGAQGTIWGGAGLLSSVAGGPVSPLTAGLMGATYGAGKTASEAVKSSAPEYLTSIFKQAAKVAPAIPAAGKQGVIMGLREGQFDPSMTTELNQPSGPGYNFSTAKPAFRGQPDPTGGRKFNSLGSDELTPMQLTKMRLPRTTKGLLENKDLVIQKLTLAGAPDEMIQSVAQALNDDPDAIESIAPMVTMQFPTLFEKSKYNMFDGKILDPSDRARMADETSRRTDIGSVQRAKIISELNKSGKYIGE